tara:strand:+ start:148 stop:705 length:558 start_codon:yes stop_codon:yes gene_type:complete
MRIISGKLKGKPILFLKNKITRPLKDSVKESIFNILAHSNILNSPVENSNILDFYSGIGSFGLECISRGARKVAFVEKDKDATEMLKKNLFNLSIQDKSIIIRDEIENFLDKNSDYIFDIIFFDPPFLDKDYVNNLRILKKTKLYKKKHIIIIHREKNSSENLSGILEILISKEYGRSKIIFGRF